MLQSKKDFVNCLKGLITPLKNYYTSKKAGLKLGSFAVSYSEDVANMEGFSRVLWGLRRFGRAVGYLASHALPGEILLAGGTLNYTKNQK